MAADEERLQILRMVQDGQLSTDEAAALLDSLEQPVHPRERHGRPDSYAVPVEDTNTGQTTAIPNVLVKTLELGARLARRAKIDVRWRPRDVD